MIPTCATNASANVVSAPCDTTLKSPAGHTIRIKSQPLNDGVFIYNDLNTGQNGSIIELFKANNFSLQEINQVFDGKLPTVSMLKPQVKIPVQKPNYMSKKEVENILEKWVSTPKNYLLKRGVSLEIQAEFKLHTQAKGAIFPLYDLVEGKWQAVSLWERNRFPSKYPRFFHGERGGAISILRPKNEKSYDTVAIFESPIDALSYYQFFKPIQTLLFSTCGRPGKLLKDKLAEKIAYFGIKKVVLAFDNDDAGNNMADEINACVPNFAALLHK